MASNCYQPTSSRNHLVALDKQSSASMERQRLANNATSLTSDSQGHGDMQAGGQRSVNADQQHPLLPSDCKDNRAELNDVTRTPEKETEGPKSRKTATGTWSRWKAFAIIIAFLVVGLALALSHHFLYQHVQGKEITEVLVSQAWMLRFGTAFAFVVNTAFAISVGASYVQYQWLNLRRQSFRVDEIDSLTDALKNVLCLCYTSVFLRQPVLLLVAIVAWTVLFAAVVTPGSLTVAPSRNVSIIDSPVPQLNFTNANFGNFDIGGEIVPSPQVLKLAFNAATGGRPVALTSTYQNESYSLDFAGPAMKCLSANESLVRRMTTHFGAGSRSVAETYTIYGFISWVPPDTPLSARAVRDLGLSALVDEHSEDVARIFVMTNLGRWNRSISGGYSTFGNSSNAYITVVNVTECQLYNATYHVDYDFQYPQQSCRISVKKWLNPVSAHLGFDRPYGQYADVMSAFGKILIGYSYTNQYSAYSEVTSFDFLDIDWSRAPDVYSGLESLFQNMITTYPVIYIYAQWQLLTAYGLAFLFTLLCAVLGSYAFFVNGASYQNVFSSYLRATSGHEIHAMVESDSNGADPLPKTLAKAKIKMGSKEVKGV